MILAELIIQAPIGTAEDIVVEQSNKLNSFKHARPCIEVWYIVHVILLFLVSWEVGGGGGGGLGHTVHIWHIFWGSEWVDVGCVLVRYLLLLWILYITQKWYINSVLFGGEGTEFYCSHDWAF